MQLVINVLAFKAAWVATLLGAANGMPLAGPAVVFLAVLIHLRNASYPVDELLLILLTGVIGACCDTMLVSAGWLSYPNGVFLAHVAPYWIISMWMLFATTLNIAFRWLRDRLALASLLGAVFGPLSYFAGARLGAVVINDFPSAMIALALAWALLLPGLLLLAKRLDGFNVRAGVGELRG
jgi:hypothetical protein